MNKSKKQDKLKTQKYVKTLDFYKIFMESSLTSSSLESEMYNQIEKVYKDSTTYQYNGIVYKKIFLDKNFFFGYVQKTSSPKDLLTEIKDKKTNKILNIDELIFEHRTYFLIDLKNEAIAYIKTKNFQNLLGIIHLFSYNSTLNIDLVPFKKSKEEIDNFNASSVSLSLYDPDEFVELKGLDKSDAEIENVSISFKLKKSSSNFMGNIRNMFNKSPGNIKSLSVSSNDESLDVIKGLFTKQAIIELTEEDSINEENIKNILYENLLKVINA